MTSDRTRVVQTLITAGWANYSTGDMQAPCGHAAAIDFTTERQQMGEVLLDAEIDPDLLSLFERKWYVVREFDGIAEVEIEEFPSAGAAANRVRAIDAEFARWQGADQ